MSTTTTSAPTKLTTDQKRTLGHELHIFACNLLDAMYAGQVDEDLAALPIELAADQLAAWLKYIPTTVGHAAPVEEVEDADYANEEPTRTYVAEFTKAAHAAAWVEAITTKPGYLATNVQWIKGRRKVTFDGPATNQYRMDVAENIGFFGSPPQGPVAKLDGQPTPRSY